MVFWVLFSALDSDRGVCLVNVFNHWEGVLLQAHLSASAIPFPRSLLIKGTGPDLPKQGVCCYPSGVT